MHTGLAATDFQLGAELVADGVNQRGSSFGIHQACPANVAGKMPLVDEVGENTLVENPDPMPVLSKWSTAPDEIVAKFGVMYHAFDQNEKTDSRGHGIGRRSSRERSRGGPDQFRPKPA